jgi:D-lactate dehydrogenase (cytochrome)
MSFTKARLSRATVSGLLRNSFAPPCRQMALRIYKRCESTTKVPPENTRSFKGQLYDSTAARAERERQERLRFARERGEERGGRNAAITFGESFTPESCSAIQ